MQQCSYPGQESHQTEHRLLTPELQAFETALADGGVRACTELMDELKAWHEDHVVRADRAYAEYARQQRGLSDFVSRCLTILRPTRHAPHQ